MSLVSNSVAVAVFSLVLVGCSEGDSLNTNVTLATSELEPMMGRYGTREFVIKRQRIVRTNNTAGVIVNEIERWFVFKDGVRIRCQRNTVESCARALDRFEEGGGDGGGSGGTS